RGAVEEESVERGAGTADVGAEGAEPAKLLGERRRREVVRRQRGEVARAADGGQRVEQPPTPLLVAERPLALVERAVDVGGRLLRSVAREQQDDPVVLRQIERLELGAVAGSELRSVAEEERNVGTEARGDALELRRGERLVECLVREAERRRRVGAAAAETGGDRDALLDLRGPA